MKIFRVLIVSSLLLLLVGIPALSLANSNEFDPVKILYTVDARTRKINIPTSQVVLSIGQDLIIDADSSVSDPQGNRWMGNKDTFSVISIKEYIGKTGQHSSVGVVFTAVTAGTVSLQVVPNDARWQGETNLTITVQ